MNNHNLKLLLIVMLLFLLGKQSNIFSNNIKPDIQFQVQTQVNVQTADYISRNIVANIPMDYIRDDIFTDFDIGDGNGSSASKSMERKLIEYEGKRPCKYKCTSGFWTIGIGFNMDAQRSVLGRLIGEKYPTCISEKSIKKLFDYSVNRAKNQLYGRLPWAKNLPPGVRDVMIRMVFNMGIEGVAGVKGFHNTLKLLKQGDFIGAANGFRHSLWCSQVKTGRCNKETAIIKRGE